MGIDCNNDTDELRGEREMPEQPAPSGEIIGWKTSYQRNGSTIFLNQYQGGMCISGS